MKSLFLIVFIFTIIPITSSAMDSDIERILPQSMAATINTAEAEQAQTHAALLRAMNIAPESSLWQKSEPTLKVTTDESFSVALNKDK